MIAEGESFRTLFFSIGHWEFELFLMLLFDFVIGFLLWQKLIKPHIHRDVAHATHDHELHDETATHSTEDRIKQLEARIVELEKRDAERVG